MEKVRLYKVVKFKWNMWLRLNFELHNMYNIHMYNIHNIYYIFEIFICVFALLFYIIFPKMDQYFWQWGQQTIFTQSIWYILWIDQCQHVRMVYAWKFCASPGWKHVNDLKASMQIWRILRKRNAREMPYNIRLCLLCDLWWG